MQLNQLLRVLRDHWVAAVAAFSWVVLVAVAAALLPADRYSTTATVVVTQTTNEASSPFAVTLAVPQLAVRAGLGSQYDAALGRLCDADRDACQAVEAAGGVTLSAVGDDVAGVVYLTVESADRDVVAPAADAFAAQLDEIGTTDLVNLETEAAQRPSGPSSSPMPVILGGVVLGLITAVFAALGANTLRQRLSGAEEIRERFGQNVLGEIPSIRSRWALARGVGSGGTPAMAKNSGVDNVVAEAFHTLRTNLEILLLSKSPSAIAVSSCSIGEGKSTIVANLGYALASAGHRVTLIDADLRRPTLHLHLGEAFGPGLSGLTFEHDRPLANPTRQRNLEFVPAGTPDRHPAEVVSQNLPHALERLAGPDRLVLVDCPPLNGIAEATLIAAVTKSVILVVDGRRRNPMEIERVLADIRGTGAEVLGVVINRARGRRASRGMKQYYTAVPRPVPTTITSREKKKAVDTREVKAPTGEPVRDPKRPPVEGARDVG